MLLGTGETDMPTIVIPDTAELEALSDIVTAELGDASAFAGFLTMSRIMCDEPHGEARILPLTIEATDAEVVHGLLFEHPDAFERAGIDVVVAAA